MKPKCGLLSFPSIVLLFDRSQEAIHAYLSGFVAPSCVAGADSDAFRRESSQGMPSYSALFLISKPCNIEYPTNKVLVLEES